MPVWLIENNAGMSSLHNLQVLEMNFTDAWGILSLASCYQVKFMESSEEWPLNNLRDLRHFRCNKNNFITTFLPAPHSLSVVMVTESRLENLGEAGTEDSHAITIQTLRYACSSPYLIGRSQTCHAPPSQIWSLILVFSVERCNLIIIIAYCRGSSPHLIKKKKKANRKTPNCYYE